MIGLGDVSVDIVPDQAATPFVRNHGFRFGFDRNTVVLVPFLGMAGRERKGGKRHVYKYLFHFLAPL